MHKLSDVIRRKYPQFNKVAAESTMYDALHKMFCEHVDYLIVLDSQEKFVGILTEHDIAAKVFFAEKPLQNMQVKDFMTTTVPVASEDASVDHALQLLEHQHATYLAIFDRHIFKGILNMHDLMHHMIVKNNTSEIFH